MAPRRGVHVALLLLAAVLTPELEAVAVANVPPPVPMAELAQQPPSYDRVVCMLAYALTLIVGLALLLLTYLCFKVGVAMTGGLRRYYRAALTPIVLPGRALDDTLYHLKHFPDTSHVYPDPPGDMGKDMEWERAVDGVTELTADMPAFDLKEHLDKIRTKTHEMDGKIHQWRMAGCGGKEDCPAKTAGDAADAKRAAITALAGLQRQASRQALTQEQRDELQGVVTGALAYLDVDDVDARKLVVDANAGHVGRIKTLLAHAPTVFDVVEEQNMARGALERVFSTRLSHLKLVPQAMAQMPLRDMDVGFSKGAHFNDTQMNLHKMVQLERLRAWTARARIMLDGAAQRDAELHARSNRPREIVGLLRSYAHTFLNPNEQRMPQLFHQVADGKWPWCVEFLAWQISPTIQPHSPAPGTNATHKELHELQMEEALASEGEMLLDDSLLPNAETFIRMDGEDKRRTEADCKFDLALHNMLNEASFSPAEFPWSEMTPGQNLKVAQINLQARLEATYAVIGGWANFILAIKSVFSMMGQFAEVHSASVRCRVPCELRNPNLVHKMFTVHVPGPACPRHGRASFEGKLVAEVLSNPFSTGVGNFLGNFMDDLLGVSTDTFAAEGAPPAEELESSLLYVTYACNYPSPEGEQVEPETKVRAVGYVSHEVDFVDQQRGRLPTNCPPPPAADAGLGSEPSSFLQTGTETQASPKMGPHQAVYAAAFSHVLMVYCLLWYLGVVVGLGEKGTMVGFGSSSWTHAAVDASKQSFLQTYAKVLKAYMAVVFMMGLALMCNDFPVFRVPGGLVDLSWATELRAATLLAERARAGGEEAQPE